MEDFRFLCAYKNRFSFFIKSSVNLLYTKYIIKILKRIYLHNWTKSGNFVHSDDKTEQKKKLKDNLTNILENLSNDKIEDFKKVMKNLKSDKSKFFYRNIFFKYINR